MGCDIHMFVEIKVDDIWEFWQEIDIDRDYELFAAISQDNARFHSWDIKKLKFNNHMPKDISRILKFRLNDDDYHSHAWMDAKQAMKLIESEHMIDNRLKWDVKDLSDKKTYLRKKGMQDFRLIYAFDN